MSHLFAYLSRMKFIERWSLMHNVHKENIQEHSLQVCMIAHTPVSYTHLTLPTICSV